MVRVRSSLKDWPIGRAIPSLPYEENGEILYHPPLMIERGKYENGYVHADYDLNETQIKYLLEQDGITVEVLDA